MLSVSEAQQRIFASFSPLPTIKIPLDKALGCTLAQQVISQINYPLFANSSVDGFAVRAEDLRRQSFPLTLKVIADIPAGKYVDTPIRAGESARIMTGAPLPPGADAVVMVEDTTLGQQLPGSHAAPEVTLLKGVRTYENTRQSGADMQRGDVILQAGRHLRPQDIAILAMLGVPQVEVYRKPRVALLSSGDELIPVEQPLGPGQIHDSNSYMLAGMIEQAGCTVLNMGIIPDRLEAVQQAFSHAAEQKPDLIISSAGVSMGARDYIKDVIESGGALSFWKVNMRPGKPLAYGSYQGIPFFGLPGNPVSSFVSFMVFVRPTLGILSGRGSGLGERLRVRLAEAVESDGRESYLRAQLSMLSPGSGGGWVASFPGHQGSGNLFSLVQSNALIIIPAGVTSLPAGAEVDAWPMED